MPWLMPDWRTPTRFFPWGRAETPQHAVPLAKAAAKKALDLDVTLPEAHNSLALLLSFFDFDFAESKKN